MFVRGGSIGAFERLASFAVLVFATGCGASYPAPTERLASSEAAIRGAQEIGGQTNPQAALHIKLAQEAIERAKGLMKDGDNKRADFVLMRAAADADLALALARETETRREADQASEQVRVLQQKTQGAAP